MPHPLSTIRLIGLILNVVGLTIWLPLVLLLIARLLRGEWRRYALVFVYVIADFLVAAMEAPSVIQTYLKKQSVEALEERALLWAKVEIVLQILIFAVVLSLIFRAAAKLKSRKLLLVACIAGGALFVAVTFWIHYQPVGKVLLWLTPWTRDLNVCTTILDLGLWTLLLVQREKDQKLFLMSGALGIQFTGEALGNSVRDLAIAHRIGWLSLTGGAMVQAAGIIRIYMWARAFKESRTAKAVSPQSGRLAIDPPK